MVYEVRVYAKMEVFSSKLKKYVIRWVRLKNCTAVVKSKKMLIKLLNANFKMDKICDKSDLFKYSIRVLKGGAKRG